MDKLFSLKYDGIRAYILRMQDAADHLNNLKLGISESFLVHKVLHSLPPEFGHLKTIYNIQNEDWNANQLISICVQEEERIKREKEEGVVVELVHHSHESKECSWLSCPDHTVRHVTIAALSRITFLQLRRPK